MQPVKSIPVKILGSAFLLGFAMMAPMFAIPPIEHLLKEQWLLSQTQLSLLFTTPIIMLVILAIPSGLLADRIGAKKAAGIGAIIIAVGNLLKGSAVNFPSLLAFTFVHGIGFGLVFPNLPKLVSTWVPREKAGIATGIFASGLIIGNALPLTITLPVVFPVTNTIQGTFLLWSIPIIIATILWWLIVKEPPTDIASKTQMSQTSLPFRQALRSRNLWLVALVLLLNNVFYFTWIEESPALLMDKGAVPELAAFITSFALWVAIPSAFFAPRLSYKLGVRKPFIWVPSFAIAFISLGAIFTSLPISWGVMALTGIVHIARFVTIMALPVELTPKEAVGTASGLILAFGYTGGIIGPLIGGYLIDVTGSLDPSLLVLMAVSVATGSLSLKIPETGAKSYRKLATQ